MKRYVNVLLSYEPTESRPEDDSLDSISKDLESEISCCYHFFEIENVEILDRKEPSGPNNAAISDPWWKNALEENTNEEAHKAAREQRIAQLREEGRLLRYSYEDFKRQAKLLDMEEMWIKAITPESSKDFALLEDHETFFLDMSNELTNYDGYSHCVQCGKTMRNFTIMAFCPGCGRKMILYEELRKRMQEKSSDKGAML